MNHILSVQQLNKTKQKSVVYIIIFSIMSEDFFFLLMFNLNSEPSATARIIPSFKHCRNRKI